MTPEIGTAVGSSKPSQLFHGTSTGANKYGCSTHDGYKSCRYGIGTGPTGNKLEEAGNQTTPVSTLIGNSQHFFAIYHFKTQSLTHMPGKPNGTEVTGGYCGSNDDVEPVGITIGVDGNGQVIRRTEDHYKKGRNVPGDYNELTPEGATQPGCVGSVPELSGSGGTGNKEFDIVWCSDKDAGNVTYRGFVRVGNKEYQIADLKNPREGGDPHATHHDSRTAIIDFTKPGHNTYIRGRSNNNGDVVGSGTLYTGTYVPPSNVITGV
jgi:hypothetical protein